MSNFKLIYFIYVLMLPTEVTKRHILYTVNKNGRKKFVFKDANQFVLHEDSSDKFSKQKIPTSVTQRNLVGTSPRTLFVHDRLRP